MCAPQRQSNQLYDKDEKQRWPFIGLFFLHFKLFSRLTPTTPIKLPWNLPPTVCGNYKDPRWQYSQSVCKVWFWVDYKPKVCQGEWNPPMIPPVHACTHTHARNARAHTRTHMHAPARQLDNQRPMWVGVGTPEGQERKQGGSKVPGSGSREGFTTARPVPEVKVPKAFNVKEFQPRQFAAMGLSQRGMVSEKGSLSLFFFLTTKGVSTKLESKSIKNGECALQGRSSSDATSNDEQRSHLQSYTVRWHTSQTKECVSHILCIHILCIHILFQGDVQVPPEEGRVKFVFPFAHCRKQTLQLWIWLYKQEPYGCLSSLRHPLPTTLFSMRNM